MPRKHKNWIAGYLEYTKYSEAPDEFHFWTAVSVIASVLRRKVWFDQKVYQWSPNFYIIFVAPPGIATKSTSMQLGVQLVEDLDLVRFGPNTLTWQYLPTALAEARVDWPLPGKMGLDQEFFPMSCLTFASSELGALLDPRDRGMIDILVDLWDGKKGTWEKATKFSGRDTVINPWINIIACTTPAWLGDNLPKSMVGGGFVSRCIFVFAEKKRRLIAYPGDEMNCVGTELRQSLLTDLETIAGLCGGYVLEEKAKPWGIAWYKRLWSNYSPLEGETQANFTARMQCHVHKLAMVLAASESDELVIRLHHLESAAHIIEELEKNLGTVFRAVDTTASQAYMQRILNVVKQQQHISKEVLYRQFSHMVSAEDFDSIIVSGARAGYIRVDQVGHALIVRYNDPSQQVN